MLLLGCEILIAERNWPKAAVLLMDDRIIGCANTRANWDPYGNYSIGTL